MIEAINEFHRFYEEKRLWSDTKWCGIPCYKLPFDAFIIQELIWDLKPDYIIETGTAKGGSACFFATIMEILDHGEVITCDLTIPSLDYTSKWPKKLKDRIKFVAGGSTNPLVRDEIFKIAEGKNNIVILDSWHSFDHVSKEMAMYSKLVPVDYYMIVEDTHVSGHPVEWEYGDGPYEAVQNFLELYKGFWEVDYWCEKFLFTFNPKGYLRRVK